MPTKEEKVAFAQRLALALRRSSEPVSGATELALRFNLRHHGAAISPQTAHKWLTGRTIPTGDKIATLANWLNVSEHWLHYGPPPRTNLTAEQTPLPYVANAKPSAEALRLVAKIQSLSEHRRYLVEELVDQLLQTAD
jgi:transcriptional regulator with XRE-family HTH domain